MGGLVACLRPCVPACLRVCLRAFQPDSSGFLSRTSSIEFPQVSGVSTAQNSSQVEVDGITSGTSLLSSLPWPSANRPRNSHRDAEKQQAGRRRPLASTDRVVHQIFPPSVILCTEQPKACFALFVPLNHVHATAGKEWTKEVKVHTSHDNSQQPTGRCGRGIECVLPTAA